MGFKKFFKNDNKYAFTLAEVVIVMGILSVMMVAFAPVISKRTVSNNAAFRNFRATDTHNGIYFGTPNDGRTVLIGNNAIAEDYNLSPKLMITNSLISQDDDSFIAPQLSFAFRNGSTSSPSGQLIMVVGGNNNSNSVGTMIIGGSPDSAYNEDILSNNTIIGINACTSDNDITNGNSVCIGSLSGTTTLTDNTENDFKKQATTAGLNAVSADDACMIAGKTVKQYYNDPDSWGGAIPATLTPNQFNNVYRTLSDTCKTKYSNAYNNKMASYDSSQVVLLGTNNSSIFIGSRDTRYNLSSVFFGANSLENLVLDLLQNINTENPETIAKMLKPSFNALVHAHYDDANGHSESALPNDAVLWRVSSDGNIQWMIHDSSWYTSDRRLKNVGELFKGGLQELSKLEFFHYTYKNDENKTPHVGVIAQNLQEVFPDAVKENSEGFLYIRTEDMFYAGLNAIKELYQMYLDHDSRIKALEEENKAYKEELQELRQMYTDLEKRINKIDNRRSAKRYDKKQAKLQSKVEELTQPIDLPSSEITEAAE